MKSVDLVLTDDEKLTIESVTDGAGLVNWDADCLAALKRRVKDHLSDVTSFCCCYCMVYLKNSHRMTIDIEHVLPKSVFHDLTFDMLNLSLSCRRCNFLKGVKWDFVLGVTKEVARLNYDKSNQYEIIHPNLDEVKQHIRFFHVQVDDCVAVAYTSISAKGAKTYEYFDLQKLETDCFDEIQAERPELVLTIRSLIVSASGL